MPLPNPSRRTRIALVCGGYGLALVAAWVAGYLYDARLAGAPYDTSGGMYAGGQLITQLAAFLAVAMVPTLLALWFLRGHPGLWNSIALASVAFAAVGLVAVLMPLVTTDIRHVGLALLGLLGLAQLLGVPLWTAAFVLFALMAPTPTAKRLLVIAIGLELMIGACAAIHWFSPSPPF